MKRTLLLLFVFCTVSVYGQTLKANFYAQEAMKTYYKMGWDSQEEAATWTYQRTNASATWSLWQQPRVKGMKPFSSIDEASQYSLGIPYAESMQNETATSPEITVEPNSQCEFYSCFSGGLLVFARWTLSVKDVEAGTTTLLLDAFRWAQEQGYTGPNWIKFRLDLSAYAGKKVQFSFNYKGQGGEDVLIDGFRLMQLDNSADAYVSINTEQKVHFVNTSEGAITTYTWTFPGGTPATSSEKNPEVTYARAGSYPVTLTVTDANGSQTLTRDAYVRVTGVAPKALIGVPEEAYLSPFTACFVPLNVPVRFKDLSDGRPSEWIWTFTGTDITRSTDRNPVVTYLRKGVYSVGLRTTNDTGTDQDILQNAIQAGGEQYVWNIKPEENDKLVKLSMGWYGNYAGSNWLGMKEFAEYFKAPLAAAEIKSVDIYFASVTTVSPDAMITVSVKTPDGKGMPGTSLASASLKASQLVFVAGDLKPTSFTFTSPVKVSGEFFITVDGMPNNTSGSSADDIAILCHRRNEGELCTAFHLLADEDENHQPTGTYTWFRNTDDPLSMALCPLLSYDVAATGIESASASSTAQEMSFDGETLTLRGSVDSVQIYGINGESVLSLLHPASTISLRHLPAGIYVIKATYGNKTAVQKIVK
ncbi:MAG: PKD domain-containing protein [Hoylesella marshii]|uniref:PKD domain-containing protein n=1 Tax=Hoylesella marshii TaxID=189722 RepID=UPI003F9F5B72